ncbi:MAG: PKD domain-containing protein, partial [Thermoplasmata archaeon]
TELNLTILDRTPPVISVKYPLTVPEDVEVIISAAETTDNSASLFYFIFDFGDGTVLNTTSAVVSHLYTEPGNYRIMISATDYSENTAYSEMNISVIDTTPPVINFIVRNSQGHIVSGVETNGTWVYTINEDNIYYFNASASFDNTWVANISWDFGDQTGTYYGVNISHLFLAPGEYLATLRVSDTRNTASVVLHIRVQDITPPVGVINAPSRWPEDSLLVVDALDSYDNTGIAVFRWDFDAQDGIDGNDSFGPAAGWIYDVPGVYTITLHIIDIAGNTISTSWTITIEDTTPPSVNFTSSGILNQPGNTTIFRVVWQEDKMLDFSGLNSSDNDPSGSLNYTWDFDAANGEENADAYGPTVLHTYDTPGNYTVTLTVRDRAGNINRSRIYVDILDITPPFAVAGQDQNVTAGKEVFFNASASSDNAAIVKYIWDFGDGSELFEATTPEASHIYRKDGKYEVKLTVIDTAGLTGSASLKVQVTSPPNYALIVFLALLFCAAAAAGGFLLAKWYRRYRLGGYSVENVFMIYHDGRLIRHIGRAGQEVIDEDILASMLTAVETFLSDTMEKGGLDKKEKVHDKEKSKEEDDDGEEVEVEDGGDEEKEEKEKIETDAESKKEKIKKERGEKSEGSESEVADKGYAERGVGKLEWRGKKILIKKGYNFTLAAVLEGHDWEEVHTALEKAAEEITRRHRNYLENWDGDSSRFQTAEADLKDLLIAKGKVKETKVEPRSQRRRK